MRLRVISTGPARRSRRPGCGSCRGTGRRGTPDHLVTVVAPLHVDEVDDDDAADVAQTQLPAISTAASRLLLEDRLFQARLADVLAGVHVDDRQRLGVLDDQRTTRRQPDLAVERPVQLLVDVVALEQRQRLGLGIEYSTRSASVG
jgi:hypothetical protein